MNAQPLTSIDTLFGKPVFIGKTRIVIADDHPFIRIGIRNILRNTSDLLVVGEANNGFEAIELVKSAHPDVLLLDMEMPGLRGIEVAQRLKEMDCDVPILALSAHEDRQYILGMLENGAAGYLIKEEAPEAIVNAIRGVVQGQRGWLSTRVAARIGVWMESEEKYKSTLDPEKVQILRLYLSGKEKQEIGAILGMSEQKVEQSLDKAVMAIRASLERA